MSRGSSVPVLVIAGVASGVGKTTVTLGLLEAFRRRGLVVQAFKVGPDFIDPGFHALITGRPSWTLDGWMCGREHARESVQRRSADADLAVVEGVMGCFDGREGKGEAGSTAEMAKWLGAPVVLVADAGAMARSAAAVVLGFERLDPALDLAGVIFNRVGGETHAQWLREAVEGACRAAVLGALPSSAELVLPERHLGLVTAAEGGLTEALRSRLAGLVEEHVDLGALRALARSSVRRSRQAPDTVERPALAPAAEASTRIAVARDSAFQFYYPDNLELLERAGARLVFFSPLADQALPAADGLYIGGGYPELHAGELAGNEPMRRAVADFAASGRPVYAECGGLMYLAASIEDARGRPWPMVGILPAAVRMTPGRLVLGYREVRMREPGPLGPAGLLARGHEFHVSTMDPPPGSVARLWEVSDGQGGAPRAEGYAVGRTVMSYLHLHFASNPAVARSLVAACRAAR